MDRWLEITWGGGGRSPRCTRCYALVSGEDYDYLRQWGWCLQANKFPGRSTLDSEDKPYSIRMKNAVASRAGMDMSQEISQHNGRRLDVRRSNLKSTKRKGIFRCDTSDNTPDVVGVLWNPHSKKWQAQTRVKGKILHLGYFDAMQAAVDAFKQHFINTYLP